MIRIADWLAAFQILPAIAAPFAAMAILLVERRQSKIIILGLQYAAVAWLVTPPLAVASAVAKLLAGLISSAVLYLGAARASAKLTGREGASGFPKGRLFRVIAILLVVTGTLGVSFERWVNASMGSPAVQGAATLLLALGILGIGLSINPTEVGISLLTLVSGFEIIYSSVEPSLSIVALLASVHVGIALAVSYFEIMNSEVEPGGIVNE